MPGGNEENVEGSEKAEVPAPKKNYPVCLSVLVALNLGLVVAVSQLPFPFLGFDSLVQRVETRDGTGGAGSAVPRFASCGHSVNCHTPGNQAGL
jgi:hypothetical protein